VIPAGGRPKLNKPMSHPHLMHHGGVLLTSNSPNKVSVRSLIRPSSPKTSTNFMSLQQAPVGQKPATVEASESSVLHPRPSTDYRPLWLAGLPTCQNYSSSCGTNLRLNLERTKTPSHLLRTRYHVRDLCQSLLASEMLRSSCKRGEMISTPTF
jgi:hypothetical protein